MKSVRKITAPLFLAVAFLLSATIVPTIASASTINTELASNPIAEIEKIGLPMSDEMAGEMRGEFLPVLYAAAVLYGIPVSSLVVRILSSPGWPNSLVTAAGLWVAVFGG
ncbi:MAG: hypothetical protein AAB552_01075 [Patescibacteria group bacterium]